MYCSFCVINCISFLYRMQKKGILYFSSIIESHSICICTIINKGLWNNIFSVLLYKFQITEIATKKYINIFYSKSFLNTKFFLSLFWENNSRKINLILRIKWLKQISFIFVINVCPTQVFWCCMKLLQHIRKGGVHKFLLDALHEFVSFNNLLLKRSVYPMKNNCILQSFLNFSRNDQKHNKNLKF